MSALNDDSISLEVSPAAAYKLVVKVLKAGLVPLLHGAPMTAKSSMYKQAAKELNLVFIDCRLTTKDTVDLTGMIQVTPYEEDAKGNILEQQAFYVPFDFFPLAGTPVPKGKDGWLLFFDEMMSINKSMEVATYQILLDRKAGQYDLHPKCMVGAAGNDPKHGAVANTQGTAAKTRVVHIFVKQDVQSWINNYAYAHNIDARLIGFVREFPHHLTEFEPKQGAVTYCGSRTLEMLSDLLADGTPIGYDSLPLLGGTIGLPAAHDLINFVTIYSQLEDFPTLMGNPVKDRSFLSPVQQFMLVDRLVAGVSTPIELDKALKVVTPFGPEYPVLLIRGVMQRKSVPNIQSNPVVKQLVIDYKQYFRD